MADRLPNHTPDRQTGRRFRLRLNGKSLALLVVMILLVAAVIRLWPRTETIDVLAKWTGREEANFRAVQEAFRKDRHVPGRRVRTVVRYHSVARDIGVELRERVDHGGSFDEGGPPHVAILPQTGTLMELATRKALVPLDKIAGDLVNDNYNELWRDLGSVRGTLFGVWFKANHKSVVWYRSEVFRAHNIAPPRTWEDLKAAAEKLAAGGMTPFAVGGGDAWTLTDWFENVLLRVAGGQLFERVACRTTPFDDRSVKDSLDALREVLGPSGWVAKGSDFTTYEKSVEQVFGAGAPAGMLLGADYVKAEISKYTSAGDARNFDFPEIRGSRPSLLLGGDVAVLLRNSRASRDFVKYLAKPAAAEIWAPRGGFISPNKSVKDSAYPNDVFPLAKAVQEAGEKTDARFDLSDQFPPSFGSTDRRGMYKIFQDFLRSPSPENVEAVRSRLEEQASVVAEDGRC